MADKLGSGKKGKGVSSVELDESWLPMGYFSRVHGLKGGLFLKTPDRRRELGDYPRVLVVSGGVPREYKIARSYVSANEPVLQLEGVESREGAEELLRAEVYVNREDLPGDDDDSDFLVADLLGLKVMAEGHGEIGEVVGVVDFGAQENLEIHLTGKNTVVYYPFIEEYILDISLEDETMTVVYLPEFLEEA